MIARAYREKAVHRLGSAYSIALGLTGPKAPGGGFSAEELVDISSFSARAAAWTSELQARLATASKARLNLLDAELGPVAFHIELDVRTDILGRGAEKAAPSTGSTSTRRIALHPPKSSVEASGPICATFSLPARGMAPDGPPNGIDDGAG